MRYALKYLSHALASSILLMLLTMAVAVADSPPPPPADWDRVFLDGRFTVHGNLRADKIVVFKNTEGGRQQLWEMMPWQQPAGFQLADEGMTLLHWGWPGQTRDPRELDQPILTFYYRGETKKIWRLRDFFDSTKELGRTASHYYWRDLNEPYYSLGDGKLTITTVDGRILTFDTVSGELLMQKTLPKP